MAMSDTTFRTVFLPAVFFLFVSFGVKSFNSMNSQKAEIILFSNAQIELIDGNKEKSGGSIIWIYKHRNNLNLLYNGMTDELRKPILIKKGSYKLLMECPKISKQRSFSFTLKTKRRQSYTPYCIIDKSTNPPKITVSFDAKKR